MPMDSHEASTEYLHKRNGKFPNVKKIFLKELKKKKKKKKGSNYHYFGGGFVSCIHHLHKFLPGNKQINYIALSRYP